MKVAPARTRATRCGPLTARQRSCAASISLNAIASPAARDPGPRVTFVRCRTVANVLSIVILSHQNDQACELLLCVVNGVADVSVHGIRTGAETGGHGVSRDDCRENATRRSPRASARAS